MSVQSMKNRKDRDPSGQRLQGKKASGGTYGVVVATSGRLPSRTDVGVQSVDHEDVGGTGRHETKRCGSCQRDPELTWEQELGGQENSF